MHLLLKIHITQNQHTQKLKLGLDQSLALLYILHYLGLRLHLFGPKLVLDLVLSKRR